MFIRFRAIYHRALGAHNAWGKETRRKVAALKRYPCAAVSAYEAARAFLAAPNHENLFEPLTPVLIEPGKINRYERELLNGLRNDQVRNIAITGEYGAGKSSVLRTFVHRHPEFVYAFVSLATFGKDTERSGHERRRHREERPVHRSKRTRHISAMNSASTAPPLSSVPGLPSPHLPS